MVQPEYSYYYPRRRSHAVVSTDVIATAAGITARGRHGIVAVAVAVVFVTTTTAAAAASSSPAMHHDVVMQCALPIDSFSFEKLNSDPRLVAGNL